MKKLGLIAMAALLVVAWASGARCSREGRRKGPAVQKITIMGAVSFSENQIKDVMRTRESRFLRTKRLRESTLESDLISIKAFYRRNGFLEAEVSEERTYDDERQKVWIRIDIIEGPQTKVSEVVIEGNTQVETERIRSVIKTVEGGPLNERQISEDTYRLYGFYADQGFVFAAVKHEVEGSDGEAVVRFQIYEGAPTPIGDVSVRGNNRVSSSIVEREVTLERGDIFSSKEMVDSQQRILDTGLFKDVDIEPAANEEDSMSVNLLVKVKERKTRELSFRMGYGTLEEARVSVGWLHRNLWKSGRQLELRALLGSKDFARGLTRKRGDVAFTSRWLLGIRIVGSAGIYGEQSLEEYSEVEGGEYTLDRLGISLSVKKDLFRVTRLTLVYNHEIVDVRDPSWTEEEGEDLRLQVGQEVNRSFAVLVTRDTRRPFFDPGGGSFTTIAAQRAGGIFGGDNSFNKASFSWSRYLPSVFGSVVAVSTRLGYADAFGDSKDKGVPEYERFYAGGSGSVRGYNEREFGPGDFLLLANVEMRYHIFWRLGGVAFLEMGNAWPSIDEVRGQDFELVVPGEEYYLRRDNDVKYTIGLGIGMNTPVGPFRLDYGFKIKRAVDPSGKKESPGRLHLMVGHAF
jgi:outer membrane protein insertion porin family